METTAEHIRQGWNETEVSVSNQTLTPRQELHLGLNKLLDKYITDSQPENAELKRQLLEKDRIIEEQNKRIQEKDDEIAYLRNLIENTLKVSTNKIKKPAKQFIDLIKHPQKNMVLKRFHELIDNRGGQYVAAVLMKGYWKDRILTKLPTQNEFTSEFQLHGAWRSISTYLKKDSTKTAQSIADMYEAISILPVQPLS